MIFSSFACQVQEVEASPLIVAGVFVGALLIGMGICTASGVDQSALGQVIYDNLSSTYQATIDSARAAYIVGTACYIQLSSGLFEALNNIASTMLVDGQLDVPMGNYIVGTYNINSGTQYFNIPVGMYYMSASNLPSASYYNSALGFYLSFDAGMESLTRGNNSSSANMWYVPSRGTDITISTAVPNQSM